MLCNLCVAQSFLGKTLDFTKKELTSKNVHFEEYVNSSGTYTLKYETDNEVRMYNFDFSDTCYSYTIEFREIELVYYYGKSFIGIGFNTVGIQRYRQQFFKMRKGNTRVTCTYNDKTEWYRVAVFK